MLDKEIAAYIKQKLDEAAWRASAESSKIAPSYACWKDFECYVDVAFDVHSDVEFEFGFDFLC